MAMATDRWGNIGVAWIEGDLGTNRIVFAYSTDKGSTWSLRSPYSGPDAKHVKDTAFDRDGNPWLLWSYQLNELSPIFLRISKSTDQGQTFPVLFQAQEHGSPYFNARFAIDEANNIYVLWDDTQFKVTRFKHGDILQRQDTEIPNDTLLVDFNCAVATYDSSTIHCLWEGTRIEGLYYYRYLFCSSSLDSGATFLTTVRVDTNEIIVPTGGSGQGFPEAIVDSAGNLLVVYAKGVDLNNTMLLLGRSSNQGASFISPTAVCSNGQNSHPELSIDSLSGVDFVWADYNGAALHTRSTDGGSTFSTIQAIGVGYPKIRSGRGGDLFAVLFTSARIYFTRADLISGVGPAENEVGSYELFQNYPNPFNPLTLLSYRLSTQSHVKLVIYDMLGREVAHLVDEIKPAGLHTIVWQPQNLASGVYLYRITISDNGKGLYVASRKLAFLK